jgi:predicted kinase
MTEMGRSSMAGDCPIFLIMLVGIPGSGKSTWASQFQTVHPDYCLVSTDQIRAKLYGDEAVQGNWYQVWQQVRTQWQIGIDSIRQGTRAGVIYDATNARRRYRRQAIASARMLGFDTLTLVWFDVPLEVCLKRNQQRSRRVPPQVIVKMHRQLRSAPPSLAEGVESILRVTA